MARLALMRGPTMPSTAKGLAQLGYDPEFLPGMEELTALGTGATDVPERLALAAAMDVDRATNSLVGDASALAISTLRDAVTDLPSQEALARGVWQSLRNLDAGQGRLAAVIVPCHFNVSGAAAVVSAKALGIPSITVPHGCMALPPSDAWWASSYLPNHLLLAGERDRQWWQSRAGASTVTVTGQPHWDELAGHGRQRRPHPSILRIQESGANAHQSAALWGSRGAPDRAWKSFLIATKSLPEDWGIGLKLRHGEDQVALDHWLNDLATLDAERSLHPTALWTGGILGALAQADVVLCEDSNAGVESLHLGIPVISVTRPGGQLFEGDNGSLVPVLDAFSPDLASELVAAITQAVRNPPSSADLKKLALHYNLGAEDGQSAARVARAVGDILGSPVRSI